MRWLSDQRLRGLQLIVALIVGGAAVFLLLDAANIGRYEVANNLGPTIAACDNTVPALSLTLWLLFVVLSIAAAGMALYGSCEIGKWLAVLDIVCCVMVMLISWTNLHPSTIYGMAPSAFYMICIGANIILALVCRAQQRRNLHF